MFADGLPIVRVPMFDAAMRGRRASSAAHFIVAGRDTIGRVRRPLRTAFLLLGVGCAEYSEGTFRYVDHPDLVAVEFASGGGELQNRGIGTVSATERGMGTCDELAAVALRDLLEEAKAIGGQAVEEVQFRGRRAWLGRVVCRGTTGEKIASVRGIAVE